MATDRVRIYGAMIPALEHAKRSGSLERWNGGHWTFPGCAVARVRARSSGPEPIPAWSCRFKTIQALLDRGLIFVSRKADIYPVEVRPVATEGEGR